MDERSARISLLPGRELRWSPASWNCSDDVVVFDACSGDFWVLSAPASLVLHWIVDRGPVTSNGLEASLNVAAEQLDGPVREMALRGLLHIDELVPEIARGD